MLLGILLGCFCACAAGHSMMTMDKYSEISVGTTREELKEKAGKPYSIKKIGDHEEIYEYIERINVENRFVERRHYLFIIKNGKITSKKVTQEEPPPLEFRNSYELQTSQNKE